MLALDTQSPLVDAFCTKWKITDLAAAVAHHRDEILRLFVRFDPRASWSLVDRLTMQEELQGVLGRPVVLQNRHAEAIRKRAVMPARSVFSA